MYNGDPLDLLTRSYEVMRETIAGIWIDDWDRSTGLDGFAISDLIEHVLSAIDQFSQVAAGHGFDPDTKVDVTAAQVAWRFDEVVAESLAEWGKPSALADSYPMPWGQEVGERLAAYLVIETAGHAWDLASALGHDLPMSDELVVEVLDVAQSFAEATLRAPGMLGPEQPVPVDAPPLTRLVSFLGREIS